MINAQRVERAYEEVAMPQREKDIPASMSRLGMAIDRLEGAMARLDVLVGPIPPGNPNMKEARTKCPLAESLDRFSAQIEGLTEYVEHVEI